MSKAGRDVRDGEGGFICECLQYIRQVLGWQGCRGGDAAGTMKEFGPLLKTDV